MPTDVIYNLIILGYCKEGNSYKALKFLKEMSKNGMVPNRARYISTVRVLCKDEKWREAELVLKEMIMSGLTPPVSIYDLISKTKEDIKSIVPAKRDSLFFSLSLSLALQIWKFSILNFEFWAMSFLSTCNFS